MITVKVADLLKMAQTLSSDGIKLVDIAEIEAFGNFPKCLNFKGHDLDGFSLNDYEEIEQAPEPNCKK